MRHPNARAEVWQYSDPGHPDHGTWAFQLLDRPWSQPMDDERDSHIVDCPASDLTYPTQQAAFAAACEAVFNARYPLQDHLKRNGTFLTWPRTPAC